MSKKVIIIPGPNVFGKTDVYFVTNGFYTLGSTASFLKRKK